MTSYAAIKGQTIKSAPVASDTATVPSSELSDEEIQRIAENKAFVREHMPELGDFIKALHAAGLIRGWRDVQNCKLINEKTQ